MFGDKTTDVFRQSTARQSEWLGLRLRNWLLIRIVSDELQKYATYEQDAICL